MAASVLQASQAFNFIRGAIEGSTYLSKLVETITSDSIALASNVTVSVRPASFRTIRGITAVGSILDELAFFRTDDGSKNPDEEILRALKPSLATTGGPLICISSAYAKAGTLWRAFKRHYGPDGDPEILVAKASSLEMNPSLSPRIVERAFEDDPAAAAAEFGGEFRSDIQALFDVEVVEAAIDRGCFERLFARSSLRWLCRRCGRFWRRRRHGVGHCARREGRRCPRSLARASAAVFAYERLCGIFIGFKELRDNPH